MGHEHDRDFRIGNAAQEPSYFTSRPDGGARVQAERGSGDNSSALERGACKPVRPHYHSRAIAYTERQPLRACSMPEELVERRSMRKHSEESPLEPLSARHRT